MTFNFLIIMDLGYWSLSQLVLSDYIKFVKCWNLCFWYICFTVSGNLSVFAMSRDKSVFYEMIFI